MRTQLRAAPLALATFAVLLAGNTGCANVLDELGSAEGRTSIVDGEIRSVDPRRSRFELREDRGRTHTIRYDDRTDVVHRQRQYPPSALERGDVVRVRVTEHNGSAWADRVEVRQSARDVRAGTGRRDDGRGTAVGRGTAIGSRVERLDGTIGAVDARRGTFTVQRPRQRDVLVYLPQRVARDDARRFERLRRGQRVRVEVRALQRERAEFVRFR